MRTVLKIWAAVGLALLPMVAAAQDFPSKPIRLIVPFPPGGPNDTIARVVGQKMAERLGQPVLIDNRGGAGGVTGTDAVAKAPPDGYLIAITSAGALAISASLADKVPYDATKDFTPITIVAKVPELLVVTAGVPAKSLTELLALAKSQPGKLNFASSGPGSMPHLAGELLKIHAGINIVHVPYRGAAPAVTDLLAGQVQMMFADIPVLLSHVKSGALRAVGVGSKERAPALPEVAPFAEQGFPQIEAENWYGMVAPANLPPAVTAKLHDAIVFALRDSDVKQKLSAQGANLIGDRPEEFSAYLRSEIGKWAKVVQASGAKGN
jgi:tripartite-type tricarboxylate transporter receptor subunit TctC